MNKAIKSFDQVKKLLDKGKSLNEIITTLATHTNEMKEFQKTLSARTIALLRKRAEMLDVDLDDFDFDLYTGIVSREAQREVFEPIDRASEPLKTAAKIRNPAQRMALFKTIMNEIINKLSELKQKKHDADIEHIAHVLALDLENVTSDSDQIYLIELHARRRVA